MVGPAFAYTVLLTDDDAALVLLAVAVKVDLKDGEPGAVTSREQAVKPGLSVQVQAFTVPPPLQVNDSLTAVPAITGCAVESGDCAIEQSVGGLVTTCVSTADVLGALLPSPL